MYHTYPIGCYPFSPYVRMLACVYAFRSNPRKRRLPRIYFTCPHICMQYMRLVLQDLEARRSSVDKDQDQDQDQAHGEAILWLRLDFPGP